MFNSVVFLLGFAVGLIAMGLYHVHELGHLVDESESMERIKTVRAMTIEHLKTLKLMKLQRELLLSLRDENWVLQMGILDYGGD